MKICKIYIKNYNQFKDFELDLTYPKGHPNAGQPLEKICLIGSNGTGKSTLLNIIGNAIGFKHYIKRNAPNSKISSIDRGINPDLPESYNIQIGYQTLDQYIGTAQPDLLASSCPILLTKHGKPIPFRDKSIPELLEAISLKDNSNDLLIHVPSEGDTNTYNPHNENATVNEALALFENFSFSHSVSIANSKSFWRLLIFLIKKRESDFIDFQNKEANLDKTIRQVQDEFDKVQPKVLNKVAALWDKILNKAGLEFDVEGASNPVQLTDNLLAYIRLKSSKVNIPYNQLSTGIRNFIFRLGHIFTLYFGREIERGFLLVDEPENSLHPDFLYDLIDIYTGIIKNTQFFVATHNPIIAAQFDPAERFILAFNDEGYVTVRRGSTPTGDDPNDILKNDFGVRNLLGKEGLKKWEYYLELKRRIEKETDKTTKIGLLEEFMQIGQAYNFPLQ